MEATYPDIEIILAALSDGGGAEESFRSQTAGGGFATLNRVVFLSYGDGALRVDVIRRTVGAPWKVIGAAYLSPDGRALPMDDIQACIDCRDNRQYARP